MSTSAQTKSRQKGFGPALLTAESPIIKRTYTTHRVNERMRAYTNISAGRDRPSRADRPIVMQNHACIMPLSRLLTIRPADKEFVVVFSIMHNSIAVTCAHSEKSSVILCNISQCTLFLWVMKCFCSLREFHMRRARSQNERAYYCSRRIIIITHHTADKQTNCGEDIYTNINK